jgi:hypothetical protein
MLVYTVLNSPGHRPMGGEHPEISAMHTNKSAPPNFFLGLAQLACIRVAMLAASPRHFERVGLDRKRHCLLVGPKLACIRVAMLAPSPRHFERVGLDRKRHCLLVGPACKH